MNGELGANKVSLGGNDAKAVFALRADQGQSADYLCFSIPLQTEGRDKRLGLYGLYMERDNQAFGCYRGVESVRSVGGRIEIDLIWKANGS